MERMFTKADVSRLGISKNTYSDLIRKRPRAKGVNDEPYYRPILANPSNGGSGKHHQLTFGDMVLLHVANELRLSGLHRQVSRVLPKINYWLSKNSNNPLRETFRDDPQVTFLLKVILMDSPWFQIFQQVVPKPKTGRRDWCLLEIIQRIHQSKTGRTDLSNGIVSFVDHYIVKAFPPAAPCCSIWIDLTNAHRVVREKLAI